MEKVTFGKRILKALQERNMKQIELSEKTGISRGAISSYISGRWQAKQDNIYLIAKALNVNEAWLMGYDVAMEKKITNNTQLDSINNSSFNYLHIPLGVAAGCLSTIDGISKYNYMSMPDDWMGKYARNSNIALMHVNGDSMNNIIENGNMIAVLRNVDIDNIHNGDIVVAVYDDDKECTIKHFYNDEENERFILRPDSINPAFTEIIIPYENANKLQIFGKVVVYNVVI